MKKDKLTIAIDGYSSCGKSTLAKALAEKLDYIFIDTGAMYRGVTLYALKNGFIDEDGVAVDDLISALDDISLTFELNPDPRGKPILHLNGINVEHEIRTPKVAAHVSKIAAVKNVRIKLVDEQRKLGKKGGVVMDGRDIGSVVFPKAELKLFITAQPAIRAQRRYDELIGNGIPTSLEEVAKNLAERDHIDSTRIESPLIQTDDAVVIDNSYLTPAEQVEQVLEMVHEILQKNAVIGN